MYDPEEIFPLIEREGLFTGAPIALVFDQPSTRTDMSFRLACRAIGATPDPKPMGMSSMAKGESLTHTFMALADMGYAAIIYRGFGSYEEPGIPVINAGNRGEHPTQALIDLYTAEQALPDTRLKILIAGDTNSRVAISVQQLFIDRGHEVIVGCADDGSNWPRHNVMMIFRWQAGRPAEDPITYIPDGTYLMAPGRVIDEIDHSLLKHCRSLIRQQVRNAVKVRAAVLSWELGHA